MFTGESKKRPTVSLRGKSREEDRGEFLRRARVQREERARERLHASCATTIQRIWRGRHRAGEWRDKEREAWDKKMHDVGRVQAMFAAAGKSFQVPAPVLYSLLSQLVSFHAVPRDATRLRTVLGLVIAPAADGQADPRATGLFAPFVTARERGDARSEHAWVLLMARIGALCLQYIADGSGAGKGGSGEKAEVVALEEAVRCFSLISSPAEWRRRSVGVDGREAEVLCRRVLVSLALGRLCLSGEEAVRSPDRGDVPVEGKSAESPDRPRRSLGVRLKLRGARDEATGKWTREPWMFEVLRLRWNAAAPAVTSESMDAVTRLLCNASLEALGVGKSNPTTGSAKAGAKPTATASQGAKTRGVTPTDGTDQRGVAEGEGALARVAGHGDVLWEREVLGAFASAMLPSPRLLDKSLRVLLVDPMLEGDAGAWWELVAVAGEVVGAEGVARGGAREAATRRRDVAWTVANILRVDTGTGGTAGGANVGHARCLVRALCLLLRRVSLHALLEGAGQTISPGAGPNGRSRESGGDEDVEMEDALSDSPASDDVDSGLGSGMAGDDSAGGGIRLEDIVRHHRRRCALRAAAVSPEAAHQSGLGSGSSASGQWGRKGTQGASTKDGARDVPRAESSMAEEEMAAMAAAAETLADTTVVGKLFDALLPLVGHVPSVSKTAGSAGAEAERESIQGEEALDAEDGRDPVLALCSLYADLVMDGVRAGHGAAGSAAASSGGGGGANSAGSEARSTTPGKSVLNALAFGRPQSPIAARLWAFLQRRRDLKAYAEGAGTSGGLHAAGAGGVQSALFLFCSAYSHQLLALDDEEFYEKQSPLPLEGVRQLAAFLKTWLCRLYWLDPAMPRLLGDNLPSDPTAALRQCEDRLREALLLLAATRLFNQLYERNMRRNFLDAESWYWPAISAKELALPERRDPNGDSTVDIFSSDNLGVVLTNIPQVIPFFQRVTIFRRLIEMERGDYQARPTRMQNSVRIRVSRDTIYEDSAKELNKLANRGPALKRRVQVTFVNQHGVEEAGIDGGGVFKEYMDLLTKRAFDPQYALFLATEDQYLFPNPSAELIAEDYLFHFEFLGRVLGKAVFEDILVEPLFSPVFLNKLLGRHNYIDDLYSLDPELYRNLMHLKAIVMQGGDVADLCLTFSATTSAFGETKVWDLIPGGRDVAVTNSSVISYIHLMAHFKLNVQTARPCMAFLRGFRDLIPVEWIRLFNPHELQRLIGGEGGRSIDMEDLKRNTRYAGGYHESQPVMQWFWEIVRSFSVEQQGQFLKFVTSCSRPPLLGFERLNPPICVQRVPDGEAGRLPSSATCMNLLKLPQYGDRETLRDKLIYAISANAGFELT